MGAGILALELAGKTVFAGYQVVSRSQTFQDSGSSTRICSSAFMRYTPIRTAPKNRKAISHHILTLSVDISRTFPIFFPFPSVHRTSGPAWLHSCWRPASCSTSTARPWFGWKVRRPKCRRRGAGCTLCLWGLYGFG